MQVITNDVFQPVSNFRLRKAISRKLDRVGGGDERADGARAVPLVALGLVAEDLVKGRGFAAGRQIVLAAAGTFFGIGRKKEFALGVRKNDGALVATFGDPANRDARLAAASVAAGRGSLRTPGLAGGVVGDGRDLGRPMARVTS